MTIYRFEPVTRPVDVFAVGVENWPWSRYVNEASSDNNISPWFLDEIADYLTLSPQRPPDLDAASTGMLVVVDGAVDDRGRPRPESQCAKVFSRKAWADLRAALCGGCWWEYT